jgi:hypothetical protein
MIPMPYILVTIVMNVFSLVLFCTTSVALLCRSQFASRWLPSQLRQRKTLTLIVTQGLLSALSIVAMPVVVYLFRHSLSLFDVLFFIGAANSVVLAYQFMNARCFLSMSTSTARPDRPVLGCRHVCSPARSGHRDRGVVHHQ